MALNWNIEKCKNFKELTEGSNWTVTDTLIWSTMFVGIPTITKANSKEFYARLHLVELMNGTFTNVDGKPHHLTQEDVDRRIGLSTNASPFSRSQFIKLKVGHYFKNLTGK